MPLRACTIRMSSVNSSTVKSTGLPLARQRKLKAARASAAPSGTSLVIAASPSLPR